MKTYEALIIFLSQTALEGQQGPKNVFEEAVKKHEGKVEKVDLKKSRIFVSGAELTKKDGTKKLLALHPSNIMVTELNLDDKLRQKAFEGK